MNLRYRDYLDLVREFDINVKTVSYLGIIPDSSRGSKPELA
jgi:hypothetical protein